MTPSIVTKNGKLFMVVGSPGGRTIINTVLEIALNAMDFGMNVRQAVDGPRFHHQWLPDSVTFERNALPDSTAQRLQAMGHGVKFGGQQGDGHSSSFAREWPMALVTGAAPIRRRQVPEQFFSECQPVVTASSRNDAELTQ
jgi:gamma-glutamyltranspeptidase